VPSSGEVRRRNYVMVDSDPFAPLCENVIHNRKYITSEEDRAGQGHR